jgi:integrase/recombinase XerD
VGGYRRNAWVVFTEIISLIREIPYCRWDAKNRWWTVPYSDKIITRLKEIALGLGLEFHLEQEEQGIKGKPRVSPFDVPNYRPCPEIYVLKLRELRYSEHTIQSYTSLFEEFINYYHRFDIDRIDEAMITAFLRFLVIERKVSISYQNQPGQRQERPLHLVGRQNIRSFAPILSLV